MKRLKLCASAQVLSQKEISTFAKILDNEAKRKEHNTSGRFIVNRRRPSQDRRLTAPPEDQTIVF